MNRVRERPNNIERDRFECNGQGNMYLTPLNNLREGIQEQDMSQCPFSPRPRGSIDRDILTREQDEMVLLERGDSLEIPRTEEISVATSSRDRPVVTDFVSGPERRILFDNNDDEVYGNGATRAHIENSPYSVGTREVHSEEPRLISTSVPVRPTSSIGTSVSSSEPPRIPVTGILEYGGGTAIPHRPGTMNTITSTTHQRFASEGGDGGDDSSSSHSHQTGEGPPGGGRGPPRGGGGEGGTPPNGNGDGDENGDGEESDVSSISSIKS